MPDGTAEQQQADQKKQMIWTDQDMVDSLGHELTNHREHALPRAGEIFNFGVIAVENRLRRKRSVFVEIQKCLVCRVVGKERGVKLYRAWRARGCVVHAQPNGLPV